MALNGNNKIYPFGSNLATSSNTPDVGLMYTATDWADNVDTRKSGMLEGVASSRDMNTALRQSSFMASVMAEVFARRYGTSVNPISADPKTGVTLDTLVTNTADTIAGATTGDTNFIKTNEVTNTKIAANAVTSNKIAYNSITTNQLSNTCVTANKLGNLIANGSKANNGITVSLVQSNTNGFSIDVTSTAVNVAQTLGNSTTSYSAGSNSRPVYFNAGTPVAISSTAVAYGGTGRTSAMAYGIICGGTGTAYANVTTAFQSVQPDDAGSVLVSGGINALPTWTVNLNNMSTATFSGEVTAKSFNVASDKNLKENIKKYEPTNSILDIEVKSYNYKNSNEFKFGFIAQELQELFPELVHINENGYLTIEESKIVYLLLLEIKKLYTIIGVK